MLLSDRQLEALASFLDTDDSLISRTVDANGHPTHLMRGYPLPMA